MCRVLDQININEIKHRYTSSRWHSNPRKMVVGEEHDCSGEKGIRRGDFSLDMDINRCKLAVTEFRLDTRNKHKKNIIPEELLSAPHHGQNSGRKTLNHFLD